MFKRVVNKVPDIFLLQKVTQIQYLYQQYYRSIEKTVKVLK